VRPLVHGEREESSRLSVFLIMRKEKSL
jgi:hypothetical protein